MDNELLDNSDISRFFMKPGYISRTNPEFFEDKSEGRWIVYQPDVYELAAYLGERFGCRYIVDIGCGDGKKLAELHPRFEIIGVDDGANFEACRRQYSFGIWQRHDLTKPGSIPVPNEILSQAIIICADVIEHLLDPSDLLRNLRGMMDLSPACLISTANRDLSASPDHLGPPDNPSHVREWNLSEFHKLLRHFQFHVEFIGLTMNNRYNLEKKTILSVLGNNQITKSGLNDIKVAAILTAYNEEDIVYHSVNRLLEQHIHVYVIDNWSTDSTYGILSRFRSNPYFLGCERFPGDGPAQHFNWNQLLDRVAEVSRTIYADWYIHHDVDEIRVSPWQEMNLREAIAYADRMGFNAIDHTVIEFFPVSYESRADMDHETHLKYFAFGKQESDFHQIKTWKSTGEHVFLADGGHQASFHGRRVFPYKFLTKHYPFRSQQQAEKKVFHDRKARLSPVERALGMHIHYDVYAPGHVFVRNREELELYREEQFNTRYLVERLSGIRLPRIPHPEPAPPPPKPRAASSRTVRRKKLTMVKKRYGRSSIPTKNKTAAKRMIPRRSFIVYKAPKRRTPAPVLPGRKLRTPKRVWPRKYPA